MVKVKIVTASSEPDQSETHLFSKRWITGEIMVWILVICGLPLITSNVYGWSRTADFEDGAVGEIAVGSDALTSNAAQATYDNTHVFINRQALKAQVLQGGTAFGGAINHPQSLGEGDEIWYRASWYFPASWRFTTTSGMKLMRIGTVSGGGGWWDIYIDRSTYQIEPHTDLGTAKAAFNTYKYNVSPLRTGPHGQHGQVVKIDQWNTYEIYIRFSTDPADAVIRIWQEGNLVFECAGVVPTLGASGDESDRVLIGNYFNGSATQTQSAYVDNVAITNDRPSATDSYGNPMIGLAGGPAMAPPSPPVLSAD